MSSTKPSTNVGIYGPSIWYDQPGIGLAAKSTAYIGQLFLWGKAPDPEALLFYSDAEGETIGSFNLKSDAIYAMGRDFKNRGIPIDGVGLQMHIDSLNPDITGMAANIARVTALGVQIHITELDVALPSDAGGNVRDTADLTRQADIYRRIAQACFAHPGCTPFKPGVSPTSIHGFDPGQKEQKAQRSSSIATTRPSPPTSR